MHSAWATRLAWLCAPLGLVMALLLFAPARWLAQALDGASAGRFQLVNTRGTVWNGQADLLLTGGAGSRTQTALPQGLRWRLRPAWREGQPAVRLELTAPCCTPEPLAFTVLPGLQGGRLLLASFQSQWPTGLLVGLGTPWNTLRLDGRLVLQSPGLDVRWQAGRTRVQGTLVIEALDMASRLSTLRPLGSYRIDLQAPTGTESATVALQTLRGELQLQGNGQWVGGRLRFRGEAQATPGHEEALANLLNIIGRRQGERSLLNIG
ncbi:MAG: general secretion pathway protein GspN [Comamonadaceae bacterium]|nr:general secretion pathway protein GspN [Comamonadaceae bacterium]